MKVMLLFDICIKWQENHHRKYFLCLISSTMKFEKKKTSFIDLHCYYNLGGEKTDTISLLSWSSVNKHNSITASKGGRGRGRAFPTGAPHPNCSFFTTDAVYRS